MTASPCIRLKRLDPDRDQDIDLPRFMTPHAAGMDLCAAIEEALVLAPGRIALVPLGFAMALPEGYEAQIRPRSGLAITHGITVVNAPGTIDSDYRGELGVIVINHGTDPVTISHGQRICQMVLAPVVRALVVAVETVDRTQRGDGGFGHTGH